MTSNAVSGERHRKVTVRLSPDRPRRSTKVRVGSVLVHVRPAHVRPGIGDGRFPFTAGHRAALATASGAHRLKEPHVRRRSARSTERASAGRRGAAEEARTSDVPRCAADGSAATTAPPRHRGEPDGLSVHGRSSRIPARSRGSRPAPPRNGTAGRSPGAGPANPATTWIRSRIAAPSASPAGSKRPRAPDRAWPKCSIVVDTDQSSRLDDRVRSGTTSWSEEG